MDFKSNARLTPQLLCAAAAVGGADTQMDKTMPIQLTMG